MTKQSKLKVGLAELAIELAAYRDGIPADVARSMSDRTIDLLQLATRIERPNDPPPIRFQRAA